MDNQREKLFEGFAPITTREWEDQIIADLKGADYEKKLVWKTREGTRVRPYYRSEDIEGLGYLDIFPGSYPFVRGNHKTGNPWFIRQDLVVNDLKVSNEKALDILMKGVDSIGFILDQHTTYEARDLDLLLKNIFAEIVEINFECGDNAVTLMENHYEMLQKYNRDFQKIHGSLGYDPLGKLLLTGSFYWDEEHDLKACAELIKLSANLPHFQVITIHGNHFHNAGGNIVEELAFSLLQGTEYLTRLTEMGFSASQVAPAIRFTFAIGSNYFLEMAKVRAARLLWAHIVKAYGISKEEYAAMNIHAVTSRWNKSIYDPYVNMLRTTTEAMSSIIGGVDSLTLRPFDEFFEEPEEFSERIARNQQLLLKEESYFDKVADPASGSYYIENLTNALVDEAWKLFLEMDAHGGFVESLKKGMIQEQIEESARQRDMDLANRKESLLGVTQYPNFSEKITKKVADKNLNPQDLEQENPMVKVLKPYRGAMAFENLRYRTDMYSLEHKRPAAFMFTYGNLAMRIARSQFSRNFFGCAGYETIDNHGFLTAEEGIAAAIESKAEIVVLCSSDEEYLPIAGQVVEAMQGKAAVVLAGYPKDFLEELKKQGIEHFIHVRSNILEELTKYQEMLGIG